MKLLLVFVNDYIYWWSWPMIVWKHLIGYNYSSWSLKYMLFGSYLLKSIFFAWPCMYICIQHVLELLMCSACIYKSLLRAMHVHVVEMQHRHGWDVVFFFFPPGNMHFCTIILKLSFHARWNSKSFTNGMGNVLTLR